MKKIMRYFIYYPRTKSVKRVDIEDDTRVQDVIGMVKRKFGLKTDVDEQGRTTIVLNYNGCDLKPTWSLTDLGIPAGAIIRCLYRAKKKPNVYVHCEFNNNQILEIFDNTITINSTIGDIRKKISDRIGIPLSTFYLESQDNGRQRLYDRMKLFQCNLKLEDHVYVKVWPGYEEFLNACMKGFPKKYSRDDLVRHYQLQIALYIAAFYGYMELGNIVLQLGARSDYPVGEHPSRQWSSGLMTLDMPELLKCPIHVAIERGQMKMVDLFIRQSILCTQVLHPISGHLPYRLALSLSATCKTKAEKQTYKQIYLYLFDKQFNLKIPVNTGAFESLKKPTFFSLPRYCSIIRWYERAQARVWRKYGIVIDNSVEVKRSWQSRGLLGYKVWIDGCNNIFNSSKENKLETDRIERYSGYTQDEIDKLRMTKIFMKQYGADPEKRKSTAFLARRKGRQPPALAQHGLLGGKLQAVDLTAKKPDETNSVPNQRSSSLVSFDFQRLESIVDSELSSSLTQLDIVLNQQILQNNGSIVRSESNLKTQSEASFKNFSEQTTKTKPKSTSVQKNFGPIQTNSDLKIKQQVMKCYERYAHTSAHDTAVQCLEEVAFMKGKSWIKQVEISKEMMKQRTKRILQRTNDKTSSANMPLRAVRDALSPCTTQLTTDRIN